MLGLLITPVVEALDDQHPQDHFNGGGMASEPRRIGVALAKIGSDSLEEDIILQEPIELGQLGFELQLELGYHLEEVYGIVAVDNHRALPPRSCRIVGGCDPTLSEGVLPIDTGIAMGVSHQKLVLGGPQAGVLWPPRTSTTPHASGSFESQDRAAQPSPG